MKKEVLIDVLSDISVAYMLNSKTTPTTSGVLGNIIREALDKHTPDLVEPFSEAVTQAVVLELEKQFENPDLARIVREALNG